jgi:hypothetical protein
LQACQFRKRWQNMAGTVAEVVQYHEGIATFQQGEAGMAADEAGATRDEETWASRWSHAIAITKMP